MHTQQCAQQIPTLLLMFTRNERKREREGMTRTVVNEKGQEIKRMQRKRALSLNKKCRAFYLLLWMIYFLINNIVDILDLPYACSSFLI